MLQPAHGLSLEELAALLNRAFADTVVPYDLAADDVADMIARDDVALDASHVAVADGGPIGIALVALRPARHGPCSRLEALGVVPEGRRGGIGRLLLRRVIDEARERGSLAIELNVFADNEPARRLYDAYGFVARRRLLGFTLTRGRLRAGPPGAGTVTLRTATRPEVLALFAACTAGEPPEALPPWQLAAPTLARLGPPTDLYAVETPAAAGPISSIGYLVLGQGRPAAHLVHLGIMPAWRGRGLARAAVGAALALHPDVDELYLPTLVPSASSLVPFLLALGATSEPLEQIEMALAVAGSLGI